MKHVQHFAVIAPKHKGLLLFMLVVAFASVVTLVRLYTSAAPLGKTIVLSLPMLLIAVFVWACLRRNHVRLDADTLTITAGLFRLKVPRESLELEAARIIQNLDIYEDVQLHTRAFGIALPGYLAGRFQQTGSGRKLFALLTCQTRVLALPERDGRLLLLSLEKPRELLESLFARSF